MASELHLAGILCSLILGGEPEVRHDYVAAGQDRYVRIDCETDSHVIEAGLDDKRGSFDSVHQAVFAAELTGKTPMVVLFDTNGVEEGAEYQIKTVSRRLGVAFRVYDVDYLIRWQMTAPFRDRRDALLARLAAEAGS